VVLLGASNLTMGLPVVLDTVRGRLGSGPLEVLVAAGHGRSYGRWSRVGVRGLPGILECGLWPSLARPGAARVHALVTDIGNDLAYGASATELARWVRGCVERLAAVEADTVLSLLPERSLARLAPWQYHLVKAMVFPGRRLPFATLLERLREVNCRLAELADAHAIALVEPVADWYGLDRIHVRRGQVRAAWGAMLSRWQVPDGCGPGAERVPPLGRRWRIAPERRTVLGLTLRRPQPSAVLADGTAVSLY
jgi:hypothetical protein